MDIFESNNTLIFDASVIINLSATGYFVEIFSELDCACLISPQVLNEIIGQTQDYESREKLIKTLIVNGKLLVINLNEEESSFFIKLISPNDTDALDDGEAATLALAKSRNAIAIIDERKGTRIASLYTPPILTSSTVELLYWIYTNDVNKLPMVNILTNALIKAKMRVPYEYEKWVLQMVPESIIRECTSLRKRLRCN